MSARGTTHARLDVHVGPGSAHTLFRGLPGPILIVCRVGGKPPPLDPATLTNSSLSRLPRRRAVLSAEKICDPRIERMIDARRFICHPHLPSFGRPPPQCHEDLSVLAVPSRALVYSRSGQSESAKKSPSTKGPASVPRRPFGASGAATAISTKSIRGSRSTAPPGAISRATPTTPAIRTPRHTPMEDRSSSGPCAKSNRTKRSPTTTATIT